MSPERWKQIEQLYLVAAAVGGDARAALLAQAEPEVRREVESLLAQPSKSAPLRALLKDAELTEELTVGPDLELGQYKIQEQIGAGGMGMVFRGFDTRLRRPVAVKFLSSDLADTATRRRFQREAQTASSLNHPHI